MSETPNRHIRQLERDNHLSFPNARFLNYYYVYVLEVNPFPPLTSLRLRRRFPDVVVFPQFLYVTFRVDDDPQVI